MSAFTMNPVTFDKDGYPTEGSLKRLRGLSKQAYCEVDQRRVLEAVKEAWSYPDRAKEVYDGVFAFSTGGWSGNEDLIAAVNTSILFATNSLHVTGGLHIFTIGKAGHDRFAELLGILYEWAWNKKEGRP